MHLVVCSLGVYNDGRECRECRAGIWYKPHIGNDTQCLQCPSNMTSLVNGSHACGMIFNWKSLGRSLITM